MKKITTYYNRYFVALYWCYKYYEDENGAGHYVFRTKWQHLWDKMLKRNQYLNRYITQGTEHSRYRENG